MGHREETLSPVYSKGTSTVSSVQEGGGAREGDAPGNEDGGIRERWCVLITVWVVPSRGVVDAVSPKGRC